MNSSILSKTLEKGLLIKKLIFDNDYYCLIKYPIFRISFSENTLTINWTRISKSTLFKDLKFLLGLWPGLILRLKHLITWDEEILDCIQRLLIYCEGSPFCCKLSFSKIVLNIDIDDINKKIKYISFFEELNKLKDLYNSLSKVYDVELENITYEELFIKLF